MDKVRGWTVWRGKRVPRRHLYEAGALRTLCGRGVRDREGGGWWFGAHGPDFPTGESCVADAVHVSKARRVDCPMCRAIYRDSIKAARAGRLVLA
jgi:hypothetical protein